MKYFGISMLALLITTTSSASNLILTQDFIKEIASVNSTKKDPLAIIDALKTLIKISCIYPKIVPGLYIKATRKSEESVYSYENIYGSTIDYIEADSYIEITYTLDKKKVTTIAEAQLIYLILDTLRISTEIKDEYRLSLESTKTLRKDARLWKQKKFSFQTKLATIIEDDGH